MHTPPPHNYTYTDVMLVDREAAISVYVPAGGWDGFANGGGAEAPPFTSLYPTHVQPSLRCP